MGSTGTGTTNALRDYIVQSLSKGFQEGDTPKAIQINKNYRVERGMADDTWRDYGRLPGEDVKVMLKGYKFNGLFWQKSGAKNIYTVEEID